MVLFNKKKEFNPEIKESKTLKICFILGWPDCTLSMKIFHFSFSSEKSFEKTTTTTTTAPPPPSTTTTTTATTPKTTTATTCFALFRLPRFEEKKCRNFFYLPLFKNLRVACTEREAKSNVSFIFEISFFGELRPRCHMNVLHMCLQYRLAFLK